MAAGDPAADRISEVLALLRARWPHACPRASTVGVRWTDGPSVIDVRAAVRDAGLDRSLVPLIGDSGGGRRTAGTCTDLVALERTWSDRVVAYAALLSPHGRFRSAVELLDDLRVFEIPAGGPPPMPPPIVDVVWWQRAETLARLARVRGPVRAASARTLRRRIHAFERLALAAGDGLDHGVQRTAVGPALPIDERQDGYIERFVLPPWPDHVVTAVLSRPEAAPSIELRWVDGPSPAQVTGYVLDNGLPDPYAGNVAVTTRRSLSATAVAASVLLHQFVHRRPYRDPTAYAHFMQRWKIASVREQEQRGRDERQRLVRLQELLADSVLPLAGPLEVPGLEETVSGQWLWAASEIVLGLLHQLPARTAYQPGRDASRQLAVELSTIAWEMGHDALELVIPDHDRRTDRQVGHG